jgi:hypothetical protein
MQQQRVAALLQREDLLVQRVTLAQPAQPAQARLERLERLVLQELQQEQQEQLVALEQLALLARQVRRELLYHSKEALQLLAICQQVATL